MRSRKTSVKDFEGWANLFRDQRLQPKVLRRRQLAVFFDSLKPGACRVGTETFQSRAGRCRLSRNFEQRFDATMGALEHLDILFEVLLIATGHEDPPRRSLQA